MRTSVLRAHGIAIATSWRMLLDLGSLAVVAGLMAGCASLGAGAPSPLTPQAECERNNGAWRQVLNFCEHGR
jgi:hypothetical protein